MSEGTPTNFIKRAIRWLFYLPKRVLRKGRKSRLKDVQLNYASIAYFEYFWQFSLEILTMTQDSKKQIR